jgi:hypothetical protein
MKARRQSYALFAEMEGDDRSQKPVAAPPG